MTMKNRVKIARRFLRSIRIDADLSDEDALDGFVCPYSSAEVIRNVVRHVSEDGQGAFTWTGPYGSGKSSLAVAFAALLGSDAGLQKKASKIFGQKLTNTVRKSLPGGINGWRVIPVVGRRDNPIDVIGEALIRGGICQRKPRGGWTEGNLIEVLRETAAEKPNVYGGVALVIDEMGKFLEAAAQDGSDIYILQQLAEAAARSGGRLLIIGVLHQAFEDYGHRLSHEMRDEWAKVQGRFVDLVVDAAGEEQIDLLSRAISADRDAKKPSSVATVVARFSRRNQSEEDTIRLAENLEQCWPLHPIVACLLGPISRRRFGQNQRSIFGFLNSSELHGFQDFLNHAKKDELYGPDRLWDYLRANLEPSILASPDGHRWALASEVLERCESLGGEALHLRLLKSIAVIDLFKERSGLLPDVKLLRTCSPNTTQKNIDIALSDLDGWSLTIYKKYLGARAIFAGSDFDIEQAVREALDTVDDLNFDNLKSLAGLQPILAKRHYHETGTMRWFDVNIVPLKGIVESASSFKPKNGAIGQYLLAIPTENEKAVSAERLCQKASRQSGLDSGDIVAGISKQSWAVLPLARELVALELVSNNHPELVGDAVARREVSARLAVQQAMLETELNKAFDNAVWFRKNHKKRQLHQADLNGMASDLADRRYPDCPRLHNELLNRQQPSGSAITAQNKLLHHMVVNEREHRLGISGFPAEGGLYASILEITQLHATTNSSTGFVSPSDGDDPCRLSPIWQAAFEYLKSNADKAVSVLEISNIWCAPPYGVKEGLVPILAVAFIQSQRSKLAIYRDGIFRVRFDDVDAEYLAKDPSMIQLRWMDLSDLSRRLLSEMAAVVRDLDTKNELVHLEPIDVGRGLMSIYKQLPEWTKRTMRLSTNAATIRDLFKRAHDPNRFLFDDIPGTLGEEVALNTDADLRRVVVSVREGLEELVQAYTSMLQRMRDLMLDELHVPNISPQSLSDLRERAENIKQVAGDFRLNAFVGRLASYDGSEAGFEGIASLAANKPPRDWVDPDLDQAAIEIAEMAQKFLRTETFARVKGRPDKRHAMAVVIGTNGRPTPIHKEFDIADSDIGVVNSIIERVESALDESDTNQRSIILAALAELSARYMQPPKERKKKSKITEVT